MSEDQLISKAKKADRYAQKQLYDKYCKDWFMICLRYNRIRSDAEDVLQNALVNIFGQIHQYDFRKAKFISWSSKIVVNENLKFLKRKKMFYELDEQHMEQMNVKQSSVREELSSEALTKMIQKLPDGYRTVFNMYVLEGYDHKEIAQVLGISVGTSKSQLSKAKSMLRGKIELVL